MDADIRTAAVYRYCVRTFAREMRFPTLRDICRDVPLSSSSVATYHLDRLVKRGLLIQTRPGRNAGYEIPTFRETTNRLIKALDIALELLGSSPCIALPEPDVQLLHSVLSDAKSVWQPT